MAEDLSLLIPELRDDPIGRGYAAMTDAAATQSLNTPNRVIDRSAVDPEELKRTFDPAELATRTDSQLLRLLIMMQGNIDATDSSQKAVLRGPSGVFDVASTTATSLNQLFQETVSRGVEIGHGRVTEGQVKRAREYIAA